MKKILTFISLSLLLTTPGFTLTLKNQAKKTIIIITNYANENYYRVYEQLSPTLFNSEPTLNLTFANLTEIQIYDKTPTRYKNGQAIIFTKDKNNQITTFKDTNNNNFKQIFKSNTLLLPEGLLEISENELKNQDFGILVDAKGGLTFVVSTSKNVLTK